MKKKQKNLSATTMSAGLMQLFNCGQIMTLNNQYCGTNRASSYCNRNIDVTNFLNLNSLDQHDEFCLAYVFTFRDFTKGTLGLAWVGSDSSELWLNYVATLPHFGCCFSGLQNMCVFRVVLFVCMCLWCVTGG